MNDVVLKELCLADGLSGYEKEVTRVMKKYMAPCVDEIRYDNLGSLVAYKKGSFERPDFTGKVKKRI